MGPTFEKLDSFQVGGGGGVKGTGKERDNSDRDLENQFSF